MPKTPDRPRGQIVPRSPGKFLLRVNLGTEKLPDGTKKRVVRSETFEGSFTEAQKALTVLVGTSDKGTLVKKSRLSFDEAAAAWLAGRVDISERTRLNYQQRIDVYLKPHFGLFELQKLDRGRIQLRIAALAQKYAPATVRQAYVTLSQILDEAVRDGVLATNPCRDVKVPKLRKTGGAAVLTVPQMGELISKIGAEKHGLLFTVMLMSALRPQEALALTWGDVTTLRDPADGTLYPALSISKALTMVKRSQWVVGPVKTAKGNRLIPLPLAFSAVFDEIRARQGAISADSYVFPNAAGSHQNPDTIYEAWLRTLKRHGLPAMKLYATRHSAITALLAGGAHPKIVAERAGHASTATTLEVYSHVLPSMQAGALSALPSSLTSSLGPSRE